MIRRPAAALLFLVAVPVATAQRVTRDQKVYLPRPESIRQHRAPDWFDDAKLGIFVHWGLYSVPAWAPPSGTRRRGAGSGSGRTRTPSGT